MEPFSKRYFLAPSYVYIGEHTFCPIYEKQGACLWRKRFMRNKRIMAKAGISKTLANPKRNQ